MSDGREGEKGGGVGGVEREAERGKDRGRGGEGEEREGRRERGRSRQKNGQALSKAIKTNGCF